MKTYTVFWLTGKTELVKGRTVGEAMTFAGYGGGAVKALDFYGNGDARSNYEWNAEQRTWNNVKPSV